MSLRMPQNLSTSPRHETGVSVLEAQLMSERAASLGAAGRAAETALRQLERHAADAPERPQSLREAAKAVWFYFVQRELCGMIDHDAVIAHYAIPAEVLARLGAAD